MVWGGSDVCLSYLLSPPGLMSCSFSPATLLQSGDLPSISVDSFRILLDLRLDLVGFKKVIKFIERCVSSRGRLRGGVDGPKSGWEPSSGVQTGPLAYSIS